LFITILLKLLAPFTYKEPNLVDRQAQEYHKAIASFTNSSTRNAFSDHTINPKSKGSCL